MSVYHVILIDFTSNSFYTGLESTVQVQKDGTAKQTLGTAVCRTYFRLTCFLYLSGSTIGNAWLPALFGFIAGGVPLSDTLHQQE